MNHPYRGTNKFISKDIVLTDEEFSDLLNPSFPLFLVFAFVLYTIFITTLLLSLTFAMSFKL